MNVLIGVGVFSIVSLMAVLFWMAFREEKKDFSLWKPMLIVVQTFGLSTYIVPWLYSALTINATLYVQIFTMVLATFAVVVTATIVMKSKSATVE